MNNIESLRREVPKFDTTALFSEWAVALQVFMAHGEVSVFRAMSVGTRRILFQTLRAMQAKDVLDIGTYNGTSALTFALAGTRVVTVDVVDANAPDGYWKVDGRPHSPQQLMDKAGVEVEFVTQDANEYLKTTEDKFDFICIDSAKSEQDTYEQIPLAVSRLKPGGLIFMDDVFADGQPMPSGYYEAAHWNVLQRYMAEGFIKAIPITRTLEGARVACAWVVRA
jgi:predicted O-methyltransferase YrrM